MTSENLSDTVIRGRRDRCNSRNCNQFRRLVDFEHVCCGVGWIATASLFGGANHLGGGMCRGSERLKANVEL